MSKANLFSKENIAKAFTEWERRYREEPDRFQSDSERLSESPETYGDVCALYFLEILKEVAGA